MCEHDYPSAATFDGEEDFEPSLILTLQHRIGVFGTTAATRTAPKDTGSGRRQLYESTVLQHMSRPGASTAFLGADDDDSCPNVPSLLDVASLYSRGKDTGGTVTCPRGYALTESNHRLVCWLATIDGREDRTSSTVSIKLRDTAVSMSLLNIQNSPSPIVYGSCRDGSMYFAQLATGRGSSSSDGNASDLVEFLHVEYLDPFVDETRRKPKQVGRHLATTFVRRSFKPSSSDNANIATTPASGRKRKASSSAMTDSSSPAGALSPAPRKADPDSFHFYQLYSNESNPREVVLVRRQVNLTPITFSDSAHIIDPANETAARRSSQQFAKILLVTSGDEDEADAHASALSDVQCVGMVKDDSSLTISFCATGSSDNETKRKLQYFVCISLEQVRALRAPVLVAEVCSARPCCQLGLLGSTILAVLDRVRNEVVLYDRIRGGIVHSQSLNDVFDGCAANTISLVSDSKQARVALLFSRNGKVCIATSSLDTRNVPGRNRLSLAAGLSAAAGGFVPGGRIAVHRIASNVDDLGKLQRIDRALQVLLAAVEEIQGREKTLKKGYLKGVYGTALSLISNNTKSAADNPQDAVPSRKEGQVNGVHPTNGKKSGGINGSKVPKLVNGFHPPSSKPRSASISPEQLPCAFVDGALGIVLDVLQLSTVSDDIKCDSKEILKSLIRSGKVMARNLFQLCSFESLLLSLQGSSSDATSSKIIPYSTVGFSLDMLRHCPDVSEYQMVSMVRYFLSAASASEFVHYFKQNDCGGSSGAVKSLVNSYTSIQGNVTESSEDDIKLAKISSKLVIAATNFLLQTIASYSECNTSLLGVAMRKVLTAGERALLYRMFADMMSSADPDLSSNAVFRKTLLQWISTLSQVLKGPFSKSESADLSYARRLVHGEVVKTERMLSLQEVVNESITTITGSNGSSTASEAQFAAANEKSRQLPPYQIERLVF